MCIPFFAFGRLPLSGSVLLDFLSRIADFLVGGRRHPRLPGGITEFNSITAGIEDEKLSAGEKTNGTIVDWLVDRNAEVPKDVAGLIEHLRAYVEGVVQAAVLLDGSDDGLYAFAEQDVMAAEGKTGHTRGSEAAYMFESKYFAVKLLGVLEIVYRN
jgi:hypothetical protein